MGRWWMGFASLQGQTVVIQAGKKRMPGSDDLKWRLTKFETDNFHIAAF